MQQIRTREEQDAYTAWRKLLVWTQRAGAVAAVKRRTHRRNRRAARSRIRSGDFD